MADGDGRSIDEQSLGELVATASRDLSQLVRKEIELAKTEITGELKRAGLGVGLLGGAGAMGYFALVFLSVAAAFGISALGVSLGYGFLCVGGLYGIVAGGLGLLGLRKLVGVRPPQRTIRTVHDSVEWARHPTVAPNPRLEELRASHEA